MSHPHGASSSENIDRQGPSSVQSVTADSSPHMALEIMSETSRHVAQENQNQTYMRETEARYHHSLYQAALKGNWKEVDRIREEYPNAIREEITEAGETVLHIASATKHSDFIKKVVRLLTVIELEQRTRYGYTALSFVAESGIKTVAKEMVKRNERLPLICDRLGRTPIHIAVLQGRRDMVRYLFSVTPFLDLASEERMEILVATVTNDMYDVALKILAMYKTFKIEKDPKLAALRALAGKNIAFHSQRFKGIGREARMQTLALKLFEHLSTDLFQIRQFSGDVDTLLYDAAEFGHAEFLLKLICSYPDIIWRKDSKNRTLFHIAVEYRQESVFNLLYEVAATKRIILYDVDDMNNNILHFAGKSAPTSRLNIVSGAALQLQRELSWFKVVEKIVPPSHVNMKNANGQTPWELFTTEHETLRRKGEKWMQDTANYCMIVAALITTVAFAAAFTVPGGNNQDTGTPIFLKTKWFRVFFISDAVALLFSSTSILMFLSILTSRFSEMDFLVSLPSKLVLGLTTLFVSIAGMLVAFSTTSLLAFKSEIAPLPIVIIAIAGVQIILVVLLHHKLCADIVRSTCLSLFLFRSRKNRLF